MVNNTYKVVVWLFFSCLRLFGNWATNLKILSEISLAIYTGNFVSKAILVTSDIKEEIAG